MFPNNLIKIKFYKNSCRIKIKQLFKVSTKMMAIKKK